MYDEETRLYYLRGRYYDPEWGRFLNADDTENLGKSESIFSYNLYEYCDANPISRIDYDGKWSLGIAMEGVSACAATFGGSFVIGALGAAGGSNFWNPFGWICLGVAAAAICVGAIVYAKKHSAVNSTETKTLSDVKVRQPVGQHYQLAYVNSYGALVRVGPKLSFVDALGMLGITGHRIACQGDIHIIEGNHRQLKDYWRKRQKVIGEFMQIVNRRQRHWQLFLVIQDVQKYILRVCMGIIMI